MSMKLYRRVLLFLACVALPLSSMAVMPTPSTNYWLELTTSGPGDVDVASGWYGALSNITVTATPSNHYHFSSWSQDTNGCTLGATTIALTMDRARPITANFVIDTHTLTVTTAPGLGIPAAGVNTNNYDTSIAASITNSPVTDGGTQIVCIGWVGAGSVPASGVATNTDAFNLTNDSSITWQWTTNYRLTTATSGSSGEVDVATGWYGIGSNVTITATASNGYHFTTWSGATNGCTIGSGTITAPMTVARAITANFAIDQHTLTVSSDYGIGVPDVGIITNNYNTALSASITNAPVTDGGTQYVCIGWTGTGSTPASGTTTNTGIFNITNTSTITWQWNTNYYLTTASSGSSGEVDVASGWFEIGSNVTIAATASNGYHFTTWSGATNGCAINSGTITALMTVARSITANFAIDTHTLTVTTPFGLGSPAAGVTTNNYNTAMVASITNAPVTDGGTQYVCLGWVGTGSAPGSGVTTNTPAFNLVADSTVDWIWSTNYYLTTGTSGSSGEVDVVNAWYPTGASVTITATPSNGYHLASWSGNTNGCTIGVNAITAPMTAARTITANFAVDTHDLVVASPFGTPTPAVGTSSFVAGSVVSASVANSPTTLSGNTTQYVCRGWAGAGSAPGSGATTNTGTFLLNSDSAVTWLWTTNYKLTTASSGSSGRVDVATGWFGTGSDVTITATASNGYHLLSWSGDTNECVIGSGTITAPMTGPRSITANFTIDQFDLVVTTPYGVASPAAGTNVLNYLDLVRPSVTNSPVGTAGTQYVCRGWVGTGNVPATGAATNTSSFNITNNSSVEWLWTTNYYLTVATSGNSGRVDVTSGWILTDSNVTITATASNWFHLASWSGDTNGCTFGNGTITVPMTQARAITANFTNYQYNLVVVSPYGIANPAVGTNANYENIAVTASVTNSPVTDGGTQYVCRGWAGAGSVTASGTTTNTSPLNLTNDSTITWLWTTNYYLTTVASGSSGSVDVASAWFGTGSNVTITAIPTNGCHFVGWTGDTGACVIAGSTITASMTQARAITANFLNYQYDLVVASPYGIVTPATGTNTYYESTSVSSSVTNSPIGSVGTQYVCRGWAGTGSVPASGATTNTGSFSMMSTSTVTWLWTTNYYLTTASVGSSGQVNVASGWFLTGSNVTITATPSNGYCLVNWSGDTNGCTIGSGTITVPMTVARSITANFALIQYNLYVTSLYGLVTPGAGTNLYVPATAVSSSVTNSPVSLAGNTTQYVCRGWTGSGSAPGSGATTNTGSFFLNSDSTVTWLWTTNYYLTTATSGSSGQVNVASGWYGKGSNVTITATASNGFHFVNWSGDTNGCTLGSGAITAPMTMARAITANFAIDQYSVTVTTPYGIGVPGAGVTTNDFNTVVSASVTNSPIVNGTTQIVCRGWVGTGSVPTSGTTTNTGLFNLTGNSTVTWLWTTNYYLTTATSGSSGQVDVASGWFEVASNVLITATASNGYHFTGWTGNTGTPCVVVANTITASMGRPRTITANFAIDQFTLTVTTPYGIASPVAGTSTNGYNTSMTASVTNSPIVNGTTQYVCRGWTGSGSVPASGTTTNTGSFNLTNTSTVTWLWTTNYYLTTATSGSSGQVDVASGWFEVASNVLITATASNGYHFASWSGSTGTPCVIAGNTITAYMGKPRAITANFAIDQYTLTVTTPYGVANPSGTNAYNFQATATASITNSPVTSGGTQYVCRGWTGTGSAPATGTATNTGSFAVTNNSAITWLWTTNYYLTTLTNGCGQVDVTSGFYLLNSNVLITATADDHYSFGSWSGATNGCVISNNTITAPMTAARAITANFTVNPQTLTVTTPYGIGSPGAGVTTNNYNASVSASITNSPVTDGGTQYVCRGWTGTGSVTASGTATNTGSFNLTNDSAITWLWTTNYYLTTAMSGLGDVTGSGWYGIGSNATLVATGSNHYHFSSWSGDTNGCTIVGSSITAPMTVARTITANFVIDQHTLTVTTPYGIGSPGAGVTTTNYNTSMSASITNSPVTDGGTQYVCRGWAGTVSVPATGTTTNAGPFNLTNDSTITWLWTTNYYLTSSVTGTGIVTGSGWYRLGSNGTLTATGSNHYHFSSWSGDTNGCTIAGNTITAPMTDMRTITAVFVVDEHTLTVTTPYGIVSPDVGTTTNNYGTLTSASVTNSPIVDGTTQLVCRGWVGTGSVPASGITTNTGSFNLTTNSTIRWLWTTNYYLTTATSGSSGQVDVASGWYGIGSNVLVTATASNGYHFTGWTGSTGAPCVIVGNTITAYMGKPRSITANFAIDQFTLTVTSARGTASPVAGTSTNNYGTSVAVSVVNSPVLSGTTQYVCLGWIGTGSAPSSGSTTNTGSFTMTANSTVTWLWTTNFYLSTGASGSGTVDVGSGWYGVGSSVLITATASPGFHFAGWTGNVGAPCVISSNTITAYMGKSRSITATFMPGDTSGDISGESLATTIGQNPSGSGVVVSWLSKETCTYSVSRSTDLSFGESGFVVLPGASNLPATPPRNTYTDPLEGMTGPVFYRVIEHQ